MTERSTRTPHASPEPSRKRTNTLNLTETQVLFLQERRIKHLALTGIFLSMFVSMLSATVVGTSMPVIMGELGGNQAALAWVVAATLLASAVTAPIWGKFADIGNKKLLLQLALVLFTLGSALAGFAHSPEWLIGWRVLQGIGGGGLASLGQIIMADIISPRERGKYMGISSAVMAVATIGGPLVGGILTDTVGWRWNFFVGVPIAIVTIFIIHGTLKLPSNFRRVKIDYLGAVLIASGFGSLLIWVSLGGSQFEWASPASFLLLGVSLLLICALIFVELRAEEPMIPLSLFKNPTFTLAAIASISVGISMFSFSVFLGQFMQLARGHSPFESGLLTIPMIAGTLIASTVFGQYVSRTGHWKRVIVSGSTLSLVGLGLMTLLHYDTHYWVIAVAMFLLGAGVGMTMQNFVLIVQNTVNPEHLGAASSTVTFVRSLGGTVGVTFMGAITGTVVAQYLADGFSTLGREAATLTAQFANDTIPILAELPPRVRLIVEYSYGEAITASFLIAVPFAIIGLLASIFMPNRPLGTKTNIEQLRERNQSS